MIHAVMAKQLGIPFVDLRAFAVAPEVLKRIPGNVAYRYQVVPLAESDKALVVAVDNPMDMAKMEDLRFIVGSKLIPVMASANDIRAALLRNYGPPGLAEASTARAAEKQKDARCRSRARPRRSPTSGSSPRSSPPRARSSSSTSGTRSRTTPRWSSW